MSTARFLPGGDEKLKDFHWAITDNFKVPSRPERRVLWIHVSKLVGRSLVHAGTPWDMFIALGHGMLGWLWMLRKGFLQRDISIGNVLRLDPPVEMDPFAEWTLEEQVEQLRLEDGTHELTGYVKSVEKMIEELGSQKKCCGFVIDGDMAACLKDYLTSRDVGERSGTYEFMSRTLVATLRDPSPYLHSPVDDLESFYFTAQWAAAFNDGASGGRHDGDDIRRFREMISDGRRTSAIDSVLLKSYDFWKRREQGYGPFFTHSVALLGPWLEKLNILIKDCSSMIEQVEDLDDAKIKDHLTYNFLVYGYRGVGEYFELIREHRALLEEAV